MKSISAIDGRALRVERKRFDFTLEEIARESGYNVTSISLYETGARTPNPKTHKEILDAIRRAAAKRIQRDSGNLVAEMVAV